MREFDFLRGFPFPLTNLRFVKVLVSPPFAIPKKLWSGTVRLFRLKSTTNMHELSGTVIVSYVSAVRLFVKRRITSRFLELE